MAFPTQYLFTVLEVSARWGCTQAQIVDWAISGELDLLYGFSPVRVGDGAAVGLMSVAGNEVRPLFRQHPLDAVRKEALRREAVRFIRQNSHLDLSPDMVARHLGQSRSALYRLFEGEDGVARLILAERLAAARRALGDPDDSRRIYQIASDFGFRTASEFSRAFRSHFGMAPRDVFVTGVKSSPGELGRRRL